MKRILGISILVLMGISVIGASAPFNPEICAVEQVNATPAQLPADLGVGDGSVIRELCNRACEVGREKCVAQDQGRGVIENLCNKIFDACSAKCDSVGG